MTTGISHKMHVALELVRGGMTAREAAASAGVTLQALYRAMRRERIGTRCSQCGHILTGKPDAAAEAVARRAEEAAI